MGLVFGLVWFGLVWYGAAWRRGDRCLRGKFRLHIPSYSVRLLIWFSEWLALIGVYFGFDVVWFGLLRFGSVRFGFWWSGIEFQRL